MTFQFDPPDGYRNPVRFPTTPASEADFRDSFQKLLDQLRDEMNSGVKSAAGIRAMSQQALINGNFDIWQRGTTWTNPGSGSYTSDHWLVFIINTGILPALLTHSRQLLTPGDIPNAYFFYRMATDGPGSGFGINDIYDLIQRVENGTRYLCGVGKKVTVSFWARSSIPNKKIGIRLNQTYGTGGAPTTNEIINGTKYILSASWQKFEYTFNTNTLVGKTFGSNNDDILGIEFVSMWGSNRASQFGDNVAETFVGAGNIDIAEVQLNTGDIALPFQPRSFAEELALCQRYYEKSYDYGVAPATPSISAGIETKVLPSNTIATAQPYGNTRFKVQKRVTPTVTIYPFTTPSNTGRVSNNAGTDMAALSGVYNHQGVTGFRVYNETGGALTTSDNAVLYHWTADAES